MNGKTNPTNTAATASSIKMLRAMVGIGVMCALMIVLTFEVTLPIIEENRAEALEKAIFKVLPGVEKTQTFQLNPDNTFSPLEGKPEGRQVVYAGYDAQNRFVGVAVEAAGQGYADIIRILYGYAPDQQAVVGFYVLETKETPGLGDKIEKDPNFLANFEALDVSLKDDLSTVINPVVTVKSGEKKNPWEVDGITGATISSRAIGNILDASSRELLPLIYKNRALFEAAHIETEKEEQ